MKSSVAECPPADTIAAFAFGELSPERAAVVQLHISYCEPCLETVGQLAASRSTRSGLQASHFPDERTAALAAPEQVIGPYRLVRKLGEGGMGEVWEADQVAPVRRRVALKLLKPGMDTRQIVARFAAERQLLALMQHPAIAQMFDAGITPGGRSYFVMEFVDGDRITDYCDSATLGVRDRLLLFQQVCNAVQHAHQKGVIHRDIKPSNVLVTRQDGRAQPKVIDFGLAKLTSQDLNDHTLTEVGTLLGTPAYASPEQMSLGVIDVDTRSDVYSLGALLYELLVGVIPFEADESGAAGVLELRRSIRELEPTRPSARVGRLGDRGPDVARRRGTEINSLRRQLRGELDWIVMKALEKDRRRRYASPGDLSRETQRYLEHQPVLAGPPTARYRVVKFVRRHRLATAFGIALLSLIVAFAIVSVIQLKRISTERDRATAEAAKASSINNFLQETLGAADPWQTGADVSVRTTLVNAAKKIDTSFKDQPLVAAAIRRTIGKTYIGLGRYDDAEPLLRAALQTRSSLLGHDSPDVAESLSDLALLDVKRGHPELAVPRYREVLELRRKLFGNNQALVADTLLDLASALDSKGNMDEAYETAQQSLAIRQSLFGKKSLEVALVLSQMNGILDTGGDFAGAEKVGLAGYEMTKELVGSDDARTATAAADVAVTYVREGHPEKAEPLLRTAVDVLIRQAGENNPDTLIAKENLGAVLIALNRYDETIALTKDVLARKKAVLGENNKQTIRTMINLATVLRRAERFAEAQRAYEDAVPRFIAAYGPTHPDSARVLQGYGIFLRQQHRYTDAERVLRQALAIQTSQFKDDHPDLADTRASLGYTLLEIGRLDEAQTMLQQAYEVTRKTYGPTSQDAVKLAAALDRLRERMKTAQPGTPAKKTVSHPSSSLLLDTRSDHAITFRSEKYPPSASLALRDSGSDRRTSGRPVVDRPR
jgi:serine/threonine protein kinase/tetratricopeptide (TPR) repeat protein